MEVAAKKSWMEYKRQSENKLFRCCTQYEVFSINLLQILKELCQCSIYAALMSDVIKSPLVHYVSEISTLICCVVFPRDPFKAL